MDTNSPLTYSYKPRLGLFLLISLLFGGAAYFLGLEALKDQGNYTLVFNRFIELDLTPGEATFALWVLCLLSLCLTVVGVYGIYDNFTSKSEVVLSKGALTIPWKNVFIKTPKTIAYKDIKGLEIHTLHHNKSLVIQHQGGEERIQANFLKTKATLTELLDALTQRCLKKS